MREENLYPGSDRVASRRRFILNPKSTFEKLREISDDDLVRLLGHRNPGERYSSIHPPVDEMKLPEDPIRDLVEPSEGAKAGDRMRYLLFTDSVYHSPMNPVFRGRMYHMRYRGIDTLVYSGRELLEARERDLEKYARELMETEIFDPAKTGIRGITVHGSSLRLDEDGMMFDARRRAFYDRTSKEVIYTKNQMAIPMDRPVSLGQPASEEKLKELSIAYGLRTVPYRNADELWEITGRLFERSVKGGFDPELADQGEKEERKEK